VRKLFGTLPATFLGVIWLLPGIAWAGHGDCGQPVTSGSAPSASDCLYILQTAVAIQTCSPTPCICDTASPTGVTATDSLQCMRKAVGQNVQLNCPCAITTTSSSTVSTSTSSSISLFDVLADVVDDGSDAPMTSLDASEASPQADVCPAAATRQAHPAAPPQLQ